jgi:hypothetical protein
MLDLNEKAMVVVKTVTRFKSGSPKISPHTTFVTDKGIIIRNFSTLKISNLLPLRKLLQ